LDDSHILLLAGEEKDRNAFTMIMSQEAMSSQLAELE